MPKCKRSGADENESIRETPRRLADEPIHEEHRTGNLSRRARICTRCGHLHLEVLGGGKGTKMRER